MIDAQYNDDNRVDFQVTFGTGLLREFQAVTSPSTTAAPADLTGYTFDGYVREFLDQDTELLGTIALTITNASSGLFEGVWPDDIPVGDHWYVIKATIPDALTEVWAWGKYTVCP